jgi:hypothetical protein
MFSDAVEQSHSVNDSQLTPPHLAHCLAGFSFDSHKIWPDLEYLGYPFDKL